MKKDNYIGKEMEKDELDHIEYYRSRGKLAKGWLPFTTYDMVQCGYPHSDHGEMISRDWMGTNKDDELLPPNGMWCKVADVMKYLEQLKKEKL